MESEVGAAERVENLKVSVKNLYDVITDYASYPEFVTGMKGARILQQIDERTKLVEFDLEMMKRLKYTVRISEEISADQKSAEVSWALDKSDLMKVNNGRWRVKSLENGETEVIYSLEVDLNFPVPGFIMKGLVSNSLPAAIREFSERAQKKEIKQSQ